MRIGNINFWEKFLLPLSPEFFYKFNRFHTCVSLFARKKSTVCLSMGITPAGSGWKRKQSVGPLPCHIPNHANCQIMNMHHIT